MLTLMTYKKSEIIEADDTSQRAKQHQCGRTSARLLGA